MGADVKRMNKKKGNFKRTNNKFQPKKERFGNANDIPLGPRIAWNEREKSQENQFESSEIKKERQPSYYEDDNYQPKEGGRRKHNDKFGGNGKGGMKNGRNKKVEIEFNPKSKKTQDEKKEIERLSSMLENTSFDPSSIKSFKDFPLSKKTSLGLKDSEYQVPTEIQREAVGLALKGMDILGAAKTGSGKTLAFLIPVIEKLYRSLWSNTDGLGALIITPTRELAYQIFEALRKIGRYHDFSAGLIIGGKDLKFERKRMDQLNIIICTPGRLLQHMDENSSFDTTNLQILVLDEADRCLDMGFERDMNAILDHLPIERQTLLFSATQTRSVKDLARLSLKSPVYVSVHENAEHSTPETLQQSYVVCPLDSKLNMLWSFVKHHKKSKILVFMSSCKQVRFVNMLFCRMRPGMSLLALHGSMHQLKRMAVYDEFCKKQAVVLFATDIAARGLDFPAVDWVLQLDCPEDTTTYIHRAGRTARFNKEGEALLVLLPSEEEAMLSQLQKKRIPIDKIEVNMKKMMSVTRKFEALLARDLNLKECAQRAFKAYLKSVFLMKNKQVFDVEQLDLPSFARSLGLAVAPRVRFLQKHGIGPAGSGKNPDADLNEDQTDSDTPEEKNERIIEPSFNSATFNFNTVDDDEDVNTLFASKKPAQIDSDDDDGNYILDLDEDANKKGKKVKTKASLAKKLLKKKIQINKKVIFDEVGDVVPDRRRDKRSDIAKNYEMEDMPGIDVEKAKLALKEEDQYDKQLFRERVKAKHREDRRKAKLARKGVTEEDEEGIIGSDEDGPRLGAPADSEESEDDYQPDLDWLPDPDKIYGQRNVSDEEEEIEASDDVDDDQSVRGNKRQREVVNTDSESSEDDEIAYQPPSKKVVHATNKPKKLSINSHKEMDGGLMEDLALQLLRGNRR